MDRFIDQDQLDELVEELNVMEQKQDKIIQLIPAPESLRAGTHDDNGNWKTLKVVAMALTESGTIWPIVIMGGTFCRAERPYI